MINQKEESYTETFKDYQGKQQLPWYYVGGKTHPALKAKTKTGGYFMLLSGIFFLGIPVFRLISDFSIGTIGLIVPVVVGLLLVMVGFKFINLNSHK